MRIPRHTRIILIPDDDQSAREYGISRRLTVILLALVVLATVAMVAMLATVAFQDDARARLVALEAELGAARRDVQTAGALRLELEELRAIQEKLLFMLGVEAPGPGDNGDSAGQADGGPIDGHDDLLRAAAAILSPAPARWPAAGFVTREFDPGNTVEGDLPHQGLDIAGPEDTPILAAASGEVVRTGEDDFLGNFVEIQHGLGYLTVYGHCARLAVARGDRVQGGQVIAYMGKSGQATATHLHFEIWQQGEAVDPRRLLTGDPPQK